MFRRNYIFIGVEFQRQQEFVLHVPFAFVVGFTKFVWICASGIFHCTCIAISEKFELLYLT